MKLKKKNIVNLSLLIFSIILSYFLAEILFFGYLMPIIPLDNHKYIPEEIHYLAQSSKKFSIPKNYILILGDSYAEGYGDWLLSSNARKNPPHSTSHLINTNLNQDVINFGHSGRGNFYTLVVKPTETMQNINSYYLYNLKQPNVILVYFYEGNDLDNNLIEVFGNLDSINSLNEKQIEGKVKDKVNYEFDHKKNKLGFPLLNYITKRITGLFIKNSEDFESFDLGNINKIFLNNTVVRIPDRLQSPALELTKKETDTSVLILRNSLLHLKKTFPESEIYLVYLPSPLSLYNFASESISFQSYHKRKRLEKSANVYERSNLIFDKVNDIITELNITVIDPRQELRLTASEKLIHGPREWKHFNKLGYSVLSEVIIENIKLRNN